MIADVLTVMWKESKGLIRYQGSLTKTMLSLLIPVVMMGIYLPLQIGRALVEGPWSLLATVFIPMMLVGMTIPESFAGERERHTLGTLFVSELRMGDNADTSPRELGDGKRCPLGGPGFVLHPDYGSNQCGFEPALGMSCGIPWRPDFTASGDSTGGSADPDVCDSVPSRVSADDTALPS